MLAGCFACYSMAAAFMSAAMFQFWFHFLPFSVHFLILLRASFSLDSVKIDFFRWLECCAVEVVFSKLFDLQIICCSCFFCFFFFTILDHFVALKMFNFLNNWYYMNY